MTNTLTPKDVIQAAVATALRQASGQASAVFAPPSNSRAYECKAPGCVRPAYAKGLCNAHYIRERKGLPMGNPVRARKRADKCIECDQPTGAKGGWGMCVRHYRYARYATVKDAVVSAMGGTCQRCKQPHHRSVFDFHHTDDKQDSPSSLLVNASPAAIAEELSKCVLLCANCHRLEHHDLRRGIREVDWP